MKLSPFESDLVMQLIFFQHEDTTHSTDRKC